MNNWTEKNEVIADFMGKTKAGRLYPLEYHCSWNWLMPVVGKIVRDIDFVEQENREYLMDIVPYARIEDTYDAVVLFIEWYNKNN